ncbi:Cytochrome c oxidase assembly protein cox15 [Irineochytrium annulatum]|nr:Cytochrome c oxidase assembly protein cox15 [Irineochytrium annulatum]
MPLAVAPPSRYVASASSTAPAHADNSPANDDCPDPNHRLVGYWYLTLAAMIFAIVSIGGLTRLTESGLSITEWNLIKGMKPPTSQREWEDEFEKYKQFPEYKRMNRHMTLDQFKFIFYMEWGHRMMGRAIGIAFILPFVAFVGLNKGGRFMTPQMIKRSALVGLLIGGQGVLGWYMVKSGLREELMQAKSFHGVSQYWLAAHLGSAFVIYAMCVVSALEVLSKRKGQGALAELARASKAFRYFKIGAAVTAALVFMTALSGAFVAGLDAGLIYNEFPWMGGYPNLMPSDMWAFSNPPPTSMEEPVSWWRNLLENPSAVQFDHRVMATTTSAAIATLWAGSSRLRLPKGPRMAVNALLGVVGLQVTLGIATLLYFVPVPLAAAHQSGSLVLLTTSLWLVHTLRVLKRVVREDMVPCDAKDREF